MSETCQSITKKIIAREFLNWHGLPESCTPESMFNLKIDQQWGELKLGDHFEPARSHLLDLTGYYRPIVYARNGKVVMFDGMNPELKCEWNTLSADLGVPETTFDWTHGTVEMKKGERIYAARGITVFLNPENDFLVYISVYTPTTVEEYVNKLRPHRAKRILPRQ